MSSQKKVVVWGIREDYFKIFKKLQFETQKGHIKVVALCCRKEDITTDTYDGFPLVSKEDLFKLDFDCIVIANKGAYKSIYTDASEIVNLKKYHQNKTIKIISSDAVSHPEFDFGSYFLGDFLDQFNDKDKEVLTADKIKKTLPNPNFHFLFFAVDHCNLNCKCCTAFSPISDKVCIDIDQLKNDLERIKELTEDGQLLKRLTIGGGEPLLHPRILDIIKLCRVTYHEATIVMQSNGLKLQNISKEFLDTLETQDISISMTRYPVKIDYQRIAQMLTEHNISFEFLDLNPEGVQKSMYKMPFDLTGDQDPVDNFLNCCQSNTCITLRDGRLYTCAVAPFADKVNKAFGTNMYLSKSDGISIYDCKDFNELINFLCKPIQFCKYCNIKASCKAGAYGPSKKEYSEYL